MGRTTMPDFQKAAEVYGQLIGVMEEQISDIDSRWLAELESDQWAQVQYQKTIALSLAIQCKFLQLILQKLCEPK